MRASHALALSLLVVPALAACKKSAPPPRPDPGATSTAEPTVSASASAPSPVPNKPVASRVCKRGPTTTVTEGRGGFTHGIAASAKGVVITWGELHPANDGPPDAKLRSEWARVLDPATLAPTGPAGRFGEQAAVDAFSNGIAPFALADGTLGAAVCGWVAFADHLTCGLLGITGVVTMTPYDTKIGGRGPEGDRVAATGVGDGAVMLLPQCQEVRIIASTGKPGSKPLAYGSAEQLRDCEPDMIDVPAITAVSNAEAVGVWRRANVIEGRLVGRDGTPHGNIVTVSNGGEVGAPAIAYVGTEAIVTYASRTNASTPYALAWVHWKPGAPVRRATLRTGSAPAMAPASVPTDDPACSLVSWTEGTGAATHVRAGLACADALVTASVIDVSQTGIETGDSELATIDRDGTAFVVWQELPKGKPAELKVAKITCQ